MEYSDQELDQLCDRILSSVSNTFDNDWARAEIRLDQPAGSMDMFEWTPSFVVAHEVSATFGCVHNLL